ncbi:MAG TPA: hypothetical protein VIU33_06950, partial [Nitrospiria bacterium]
MSFAIDLRRSVSDEESIILFDPVFGSLEFEVEGETTEFNIGVRKIFDEFSIIRPFLGGGLSFIDGEFSASVPGFGSISESGNGTGIWFSGGVYFTFAGHLNLGLELGFSTAEIEIVDEDV